MNILAIDPGTFMSGAVVVEPFFQQTWNIYQAQSEASNLDCLRTINSSKDTLVAIETMSNQDARAGGDVIGTCVWIGRFWQCAVDNGLSVTTVPRHAIKSHFKAKNDGDIRAALIDRFGPPFESEVYTPTGRNGQPLKPRKRRRPGTLAPLTGHAWQAFALAVYVMDRQ